VSSDDICDNIMVVYYDLGAGPLGVASRPCPAGYSASKLRNACYVEAENGESRQVLQVLLFDRCGHGIIGTPSGHALMPMQRLARRYTEQARSG
jgi:hypothetical protein